MPTSTRAVSLVLAAAASVAAVAAAAPAPHAPRAPARRPSLPPMVGLTEQWSVRPTEGFIDDAIASDGQRLVYVIADSAGSAVAHVLDLATKSELATLELAPVTPRPTTVALVGDAVLTIGTDDDGRDVAGVVTPEGGIAWRVGPVDRITPITRDGVAALALVTRTDVRGGARFTVELRAVATGKRLGKVRSLDLDATGRVGKLGFTVNHWTEGGTRAVGILEGTWDRKQDQRAPDREATYDLVRGEFTAKATIVDVVAHRRRLLELAGLAPGGLAPAFARLSPDRTTLSVWQAGRAREITLGEPLAQYQPASLELATVGTGPTAPVWLALQVDPTNAGAVARKRADPEYWDLFAVDGGVATRRGRLLATGQHLTFGMATDAVAWVLERNVGFDRGGKSLRLVAVADAP
ncbi:MAG: hypothetical protein R2939_04270 [Kofleriaceae bacterium]